MPQSPRTTDEFPSRSPVVGELLDSEPASSRALGISQQQVAKMLSYWLDSVFVVPGLGWRFGLDPIIGLIPVAGDLATSLISFYILSLAVHLGVPRSTLMRMT